MSDLPDSLSEASEQFFRSSPELSFPQALASKFPRIANELISLKDDPVKLKAYFNGLTQDLRGRRKGFPFDVLLDIHSLREFMIGDVNNFQLDDTTKWVS